MERKTLYLLLLEFLSLIVATNAGFNSTSDNCIDFALANVEELISTLRKLENPEIGTFDDPNDDGMKLEAFGNLKSDWSRLQLLYDKLPEDSVIKKNFKHLIRLLMFAHDEATGSSNLSQSTKFQDAFHLESTVSAIENRADAKDNKSSVAEEEEFLISTSQNVGEILKTVLTTPTSVFAENPNNTNHKYNFTASFIKSIEDDLDAVLMKSVTEVFAEDRKENEANDSDSETSTKFSITSSAPISTLDYRGTSLADSILTASSEIFEQNIVFSTTKYEESHPSAIILLPESTSTSNKVDSTAMTEKILKEELKESLASEKDPSANITNTITEIQSLNSMPSESALISTTEDRNINYSPQPTLTVDQIEQSFTTEKYSLNATISSFASTINPIILSITNDRPATDTLLTTNLTAGPINEISIFNETKTQSTLNFENYSSSIRPNFEFDEYSGNAKSQSMVNFPIKKSEENRSKNGNYQMENSLNINKTTANVSSTMDSPENPPNITFTMGKDREVKLIKNNEDKKLTSQNNRTEDSIIEKSAIGDSTESTFSVSQTTETDGKSERTSVDNKNDNWSYLKLASKIWWTTDSTNVTPNIDKNEDIELKSENNQSEISTSETFTSATEKITNSIEKISSIAPLFEKHENINLTSKNNESKVRMTEKSTDEERRSSSITIPTIQAIRDIEFPSENNETKVSINDKSISDTNTTELIAKTKFIDAGNKFTQNFVSIELSTEAQESSTINYAEKSRIYEMKNQINISKGSEAKNKTVIPETVLITENNSSDNDNEKSVESTSKKLNDVTTVTESSQMISHSDFWLVKHKPHFEKNPLNTGVSRNNNIFVDYKHASNDSVNEKNVESPQIVLYESGAGARTGSLWRPQLVRQPPPGNNIRNFDNFHTNVGPYGKPVSSADDTRADIRKDEKNPTKFLSRGSRINSLKSRKRGSVNADVEKQFRWFYRQGQMDPAHKSRDNESHNTIIKIQCKKAQRH